MEDNSTFANSIQLNALIEKRVTAVRTKDIPLALSIFDEQIISYDVVVPLQFKGLDQIRQRLTEWLGSFEGNIGFEVTEVDISISGTLAAYHCLNHVWGTTKKGDGLDMYYRESTFCRLDGAEWKITHSHTSVPFDPADGKAALGLKPE